jgi:hypothetical protein
MPLDSIGPPVFQTAKQESYRWCSALEGSLVSVIEASWNKSGEPHLTPEQREIDPE